jgi:S-adenosylmethionine hydrolase
MLQENKVKLFEVYLDTKTNDIHIIFENILLEELKINKEQFYEKINNEKGLELEIRKICKTLIESEQI